MRTDTCANCGRTIHLVKIGPDTFKWATDPEKPKDTWKCGDDPAFPVRSHHPVSGREAHR